MTIWRRLCALGALSLLCNCGTITPDIEQGTASADGRYVYATALHVRCEMKEAITLAVNRRSAYFLEKWSAKITMTLSADEKLNLSGTAGVSESFAGSALRSLALGFGGSLNQQAIRKIDVTWYESFPELLALPDQECRDPPGPRILGDLKLKESLFAGIFPATAPGVAFRGFADDGGPLESIQNTITFNLETGGSANPSFVLTNVVFNAAGPAILANRERSDQLLITMGPGNIEDTKRPLSKVVIRPSRELLEAHNTGRIGLQFQIFNPPRFFQ